ncbi:MAG TPA: hypothetical protein VLN42_12350 [Casimicrobiaceae bacterium]|nr:hypothetical protein [Casimicrobiaceae bacterium]
MQHPFANIVWHALAGPHANHAAGTDEARRYARRFSPIIGFADPEHPHIDALGHVMRDNRQAARLYQRMGFRLHGESGVRVISKG